MTDITQAPEAPVPGAEKPSETNQVAPGEGEEPPPKSAHEIEIERQKKELARERQRIGTITRHRYEQSARADAAEAKLRELEAKLQQSSVASEEPKLEGFKTYDEYTRALARFEAQQLVAKELGGLRDSVSKTREQQAADYQRAEAVQAFEKACLSVEESGKKLYPDFEKVITEAPNLGPFVGDLVFRTSKAPEISYYLAKNPHIGLEIANMAPQSAALAIGRLESDFAARRTTQAPPPPPEIGNNAGANKKWSPDDVSVPVGDWIKRMNKLKTGKG